MTTLNQAVRTFNVHRAAQDALNNEYKTRQRVDDLERRMNEEEKRQTHTWKILGDFMYLSFWKRLRWLLRGPGVFLLVLVLATSLLAAPGLYSTTLYREETFTRVLTWRDSTSALVNLTGYHANLRIYYSPAGSDTLILTLTDTSGLTLGGVLGTVTWIMTDAQTKLFPVGPCRYELRMTDSGGGVTYLLYGNLTVRDRGNL